MYKYIVLVVIALTLASCVTNWERNRKLNEEILHEYIARPTTAMATTLKYNRCTNTNK
tara:strand:+ start:453 stop:626 length:174 start_codon:yes stop_codon:yes gene_type:complete